MESPAHSHESGEIGELPAEEAAEAMATTTSMRRDQHLPPPPLFPPPPSSSRQQQQRDGRDRRPSPWRESNGSRGGERDRWGGDGDGWSRGGDDRNRRRQRSRSRSRSRERDRDHRDRDRGGRDGGRDRRDRRPERVSLPPPPPPPPRKERTPTPPLDEDEAAAKLEAALSANGGARDEGEDVEAMLAARRAARAAIMAKYKSQQQGGGGEGEEEATAATGATATTAAAATTTTANGAPSAAAADERLLDADAAGASLWQHRAKEQEREAEAAAAAAAKAKEKQKEKSTTPDIFAEGDVDEGAFAPAPAVGRNANAPRGLADAFDDAEGYYKFQVGERIGPPLSSLAGAPSSAPSSAAAAPPSAVPAPSCSREGRYEVFATHGKGVFSTVLRARDLLLARRDDEKATRGGVGVDVKDGADGADAEVAIKVIRSNELMRRAGQLEASILEKLAENDKLGKRHCVRLLTRFEHRGHLCLVFEPLDSDLRALAARYGRGVGLSLQAVRAYATQLLLALSHVASCGVVHADVKPDNVLVSKDRSRVVLADFGSALFVGGDNEVTPYLVSRFYRAPEIILGLRYSYPCDVWSLGCLLFELYTGKVAFPGRTNNEMLSLFQATKGPMPKKMVKRGLFAGRHFENVAGGEGEQIAFAAVRDDPISGRPMRTVVRNPRVEADVARRLEAAAAGAGSTSSAEERADVAALVDLLERMFALDPERRITAKEALKHPFIARGISVAGGGGRQQR